MESENRMREKRDGGDEEKNGRMKGGKRASEIKLERWREKERGNGGGGGGGG